jgi:hypothetical protein
VYEELIRRLAGGADPGAIAAWRDAADGLAPAVVRRLALAERFRDGAGAIRHLGPAARALAAAEGGPAAAAARDVLVEEFTPPIRSDRRSLVDLLRRSSLAGLEARRVTRATPVRRALVESSSDRTG